MSRINSSLLGWHVAPAQLLKLAGWYEAGKIHAALSNDMVRSKSEVVIANMLHGRGITVFCKKPLFAPDGTMYLRDFTLVWQGDEIYWEHVGRLHDPIYVEKWTAKCAWYEKFFPGKRRISYEKDPGNAPSAPKSPLDVSLQADAIIRTQ
jgi:exodeoxyribonuclease V alpha subunit